MGGSEIPRGQIDRTALRDGLDEVAAAQRRATIAKSADSYISAFRSWIAFTELMEIHPFQPTVYDVSNWVAIMRKGSSAKTYVSSLRWLFRHHNASLSWDNAFLKQQLDGFDKATRTPKADFLYIDWPLAKKLVAFSYSRDRVEQAILYAVSAAVMPRLKNELLPLCWNRLDQHSRVVFDPENRHVKILLKSRKNRPEGDEIVRPCLCRGEKHPLCAVHALISYRNFRQFPAGYSGAIFSTSYTTFLRQLRADLKALEVPNSAKFGTKAFRRGTALEMANSGHSLAEILVAGGWKSSAFAHYLSSKDVDFEGLFRLIDKADEKDDPPEAGASAGTKRPRSS